MTVAHGGRPAALVAGLPLLVAMMVAACGSQPASATAALPTAAPTVASSPVPTAQPSTTPVGSAGTASTDVRRDPSLLGLLPPAIGAVTVEEEPESFTEAVSDPDFVASVEAAAFPLAADGTNVASGVIARLRPGVFSDGFFRDWRDSYNEGACAQAGGVVGNAEAQLGGRTTYITSCAGGLLVYHAWIEERGVLVSLFSVGDGRFGERLMDGLRP